MKPEITFPDFPLRCCGGYDHWRAGGMLFLLVLPHVGLTGTVILTNFSPGMTLALAFFAILVYPQELVTGNVSLVAGLSFGLAFGVTEIGSALLRKTG